MYRLIKLLLLLTPFLFVSCLDIVEEIDLNSDNSGKASYTFNLSQSKVKLNAALKLDSIGGHKIPKLYEVESEIRKAVNELKSKDGIVDATYSIDKTEYIYLIEVRFKSLNQLNLAIQNMTYWEKSKWKPTNGFYEHKNDVIIKKGEKVEVPSNKENEFQKHKENIAQGNYTFILRSPNFLEPISPSALKLSGNKKAVMYRSNLFDLINNKEAVNLKISTK